MLDLVSIVQTAGYLGIFLIIFSESGIFLGFFLPGDSLLFTAGFLASQGYLDIIVLALLTFAGAVLGDNFGYAFGRKVGPYIFRREDSLFFHKEHIARTERFYAMHGGKTIAFARFFPVLRTFAPILAGVGKMNYRVFLFYNLIGGAVWAIGIPLAGFFLGSVVPNAERYILPIVLFIMLTSLIPVFVHLGKRLRPRVAAFAKKFFSKT